MSYIYIDNICIQSLTKNPGSIQYNYTGHAIPSILSLSRDAGNMRFFPGNMRFFNGNPCVMRSDPLSMRVSTDEITSAEFTSFSKVFQSRVFESFSSIDCRIG